MKIREYSDIHLDWYSQLPLLVDGVLRPEMWYPPELPDDKDTVLILAGDLWIGTRFIEFAGFSWIGYVAKRFKYVLIVLGNHDYWPTSSKYSLNIVNGGDTCNAMLVDMKIDNVKVLDRDIFYIDDYVFVGATLWTDMDKGDPLTMHSMQHCMNKDGDISYSTGKDGAWERFSSARWVQTFDKHSNYIRLIAEQNKAFKVVVITHHIPLMHLGDPQYRGNRSNAYYMSDLSDLILDNDNIVAWFYGHTHYQNFDSFPSWSAEGDGCLMVNNCVGYQGEHMEQQGRVKHEVIYL
jgi:predicted phosphohydrolase